MNHNGKAKRGVVRFLSCLMAVLVCATLAIEVGAETVPQTTPIEASIVENVQEETIETAPESKKETASEDIKQPSDDVDKAREEIAAMRKRLEKQMTLVYISLGVSVTGVLIGVIAVILTLVKKPEGLQVDVTKLASRKDVERLDQQNAVLKKELSMLDSKQDKQMLEMSRKMNDIQLKARPVSATASKPVPKTRPADVLDVLQKTGEKEALKVCNLKLVYSSFGSESSYLQACTGPSEYVLYDDDTVEYVNPNSDAMKRLSGWLSDGLFYLFNPVLNGKEIDITTTSQLTSGYYQAGSTKCRAKVRQINGGDYKCAEKGTVVMNVV